LGFKKPAAGNLKIAILLVSRPSNCALAKIVLQAAAQSEKRFCAFRILRKTHRSPKALDIFVGVPETSTIAIVSGLF
jgi:hypothetical protein